MHPFAIVFNQKGAVSQKTFTGVSVCGGVHVRERERERKNEARHTMNNVILLALSLTPPIFLNEYNLLT